MDSSLPWRFAAGPHHYQGAQSSQVPNLEHWMESLLLTPTIATGLTTS